MPGVKNPMCSAFPRVGEYRPSQLLLSFDDDFFCSILWLLEIWYWWSSGECQCCLYPCSQHYQWQGEGLWSHMSQCCMPVLCSAAMLRDPPVDRRPVSKFCFSHPSWLFVQWEAVRAVNCWQPAPCHYVLINSYLHISSSALPRQPTIPQAFNPIKRVFFPLLQSQWEVKSSLGHMDAF